jgi:hypothetical protein
VTSGNASLFRLSGERDPYEADGGSRAARRSDPDKYLAVIVKDGAVVKNDLTA